jgi:hypothetical protein
MVRSAATFAFIALIGTTLSAQGQGRYSDRNQGIPPGQMPPAGQCRVWYDGVPPGGQPRATSCREAERIAARNGNARVIYGSDTRGRDNRGWEQRDRDRARTAERWPGDSRSDRRFDREGYDQGYRDGISKAQEDVRDNDRYDPARHGWYKSADRGYNSRYGSKDDYRAAYRAGFVEGYDNAYRPYRNSDNRSGSVFDRIFNR